MSVPEERFRARLHHLCRDLRRRRLTLRDRHGRGFEGPLWLVMLLALLLLWKAPLLLALALIAALVLGAELRLTPPTPPPTPPRDPAPPEG